MNEGEEALQALNEALGELRELVNLGARSEGALEELTPRAWRELDRVVRCVDGAVERVLDAPSGEVMRARRESCVSHIDPELYQELIHGKERRHELKCHRPYFRAIAMGHKTFEVRVNDRGFRKGDVLILREWDEVANKPTGGKAFAEVGYVLDGSSPGVVDGVKPGFVVMSLRDVVAMVVDGDGAVVRRGA